jgi:hypothetical protein
MSAPVHSPISSLAIFRLFARVREIQAASVGAFFNVLDHSLCVKTRHHRKFIRYGLQFNAALLRQFQVYYCIIINQYTCSQPCVLQASQDRL